MAETLRERMKNRSEKILSEKDSKYKELVSKLREINPKAPLERGFSRVLQEGKWVRNRSDFDTEKDLQIEWKDGEVHLQQQTRK